MAELLTIMLSGVFIGSMCTMGLYEMIKARKAVRKFFKLSQSVEQLYGLFTLTAYGEIDSKKVEVCFELELTREDIEEILKLAQQAIDCCKENELLEYEEPTVISTYDKLCIISTELRRWLWLNKEV